MKTMTTTWADQISFTGGTLFYPCSGIDIQKPVAQFLPQIQDFWFVDLNYSRRFPTLEKYQELSRNTPELFCGTTLRTKEEFEIELTQITYWCPQTSREFRVHFCGGRGYDAFRIFFKSMRQKISIFYHRGDSVGDGGSGFYWLSNGRLKNVLEYLESPGLIVTDGSLARSEFKKFHWNRDVGSEVVSDVDEFSCFGHQFTCIGFAGMRYGPTLIWKVE